MAGELFFAIPGDIEARTGGYLYDKRLIGALRRQGWTVRILNWPGSFPSPALDDLTIVASSLATCPDGALVVVDGLAFGVMPELAWAERVRLRLVALVHHPLALEAGLSTAAAAALTESERLALVAARIVIATSETTAGILTADYGVAPGRLVVAKPGVGSTESKVVGPLEPSPSSHPLPSREGASNLVSPPRWGKLGGGGRPTRLLSIGTITPRKGHDILVAALALIADLDWHCTIVGSLERAPDTARALRAQIKPIGLEDRVTLAGEVDDPEPYYRTADIFALATRYEGYGMAFAEALAHGLPVVGTRAGAVPEVVPDNAGILVAVDDVAALAAALRVMIADQVLRQRFADGARAAASKLWSWNDTASRVASALDQIHL